MLATTRATSSSSSGEQQRKQFHASISSSATCGSTPCHSRCPVSEAMVELRSPSLTPSCTSCRHSASERRFAARVPQTTASVAMRQVWSPRRAPGAQTYRVARSDATTAARRRNRRRRAGRCPARARRDWAPSRPDGRSRDAGRRRRCAPLQSRAEVRSVAPAPRASDRRRVWGRRRAQSDCNFAGHDADIGVGPAREPCAIVAASVAPAAAFPSDQRRL